MSLGDRLASAADQGEYKAIPKGTYQGVLAAVKYQPSTDNFSENVNLEFRITGGEYENRKIWTSCYTYEPQGDQRDPIWKLAKNLKGLGLKLDQFESVQDAALAIESTGLNKSMEIEVTSFTNKEGVTKNNGFVKSLLSESVAGPDDVL